MAEFQNEHTSPPPSERGDTTGRARILDFHPDSENPDQVVFYIGSNVKGDDVLATLRYLGGVEGSQHTVEGLLNVNREQGLLNNLQIGVNDPVGEVNEQAVLQRRIVLGGNPTLDDVKDALRVAYKHRAENPEALQTIVDQKLQLMLATFIDHGCHDNSLVKVTNRNEILTADEYDVAEEIEAMRRAFGGDAP